VRGSGKRDGPELSEENDRLRRALDELSVLEEIAAATGADQPLQSILATIVEKSVHRLGAEQGTVHLLGGDSSKPMRTLLRRPGSSVELLPYRLDDQIAGWMLKYRRPLRVNDTADAAQPLVQGLAQMGVRSMLSVPLAFQGAILGTLNLFNGKSPDGFSEEDERVLSIVASHSAQVIQAAKVIGELHDNREALEKENSQLRREVRDRFSESGLVGTSRKLSEILRLIEKIRDTNVDVLVTGESGTGKELIAKAIHYTSTRAKKPFVALNCAALPQDLLESELFGIERGVATGVERRMGQFEAAHGGTLFLDEVGDLDKAAQAKILRALQERVVRRVGGGESIPIDVRIVVATNRDLEAAVREGRFREDLFYRLKVIRIHLPPLRERPEDIPALIRVFADRFCKEFNRPPVTFTAEAVAQIASGPWPGNVRELQNEVKRIVLCAPGPRIGLADLADELSQPAPAGGEVDAQSLEESLAAFEKRLLIQALEASGGNQAQAARTLGLSRPGLFKKLKRFGLKPGNFENDAAPRHWAGPERAEP